LENKTEVCHFCNTDKNVNGGYNLNGKIVPVCYSCMIPISWSWEDNHE
jgi:hypothetical protein